MERALTFAAFMLLIAVVFGDVALRELTGTGLHWARQAGVYANLCVVMLGMGLASADGVHLRPRFADGWLPASWNPWIGSIREWLMAAFCAAFAGVASLVVVDSFQMQERSAILRVVVWPFQAVIPLAFLLATVRHALFAIYAPLRPAGPERAR